MCRQNKVWGRTLIAFGAGWLIGLWISGGFISHCLGIGLIVLGIYIARF